MTPHELANWVTRITERQKDKCLKVVDCENVATRNGVIGNAVLQAVEDGIILGINFVFDQKVAEVNRERETFKNDIIQAIINR